MGINGFANEVLQKGRDRPAHLTKRQLETREICHATIESQIKEAEWPRVNPRTPARGALAGVTQLTRSVLTPAPHGLMYFDQVSVWLGGPSNCGSDRMNNPFSRLRQLPLDY